MFEATGALRDTFIVDDPDEPQSLLEEEYVPHISVDGITHKMPYDQQTTSCGAEFHVMFASFIKLADWKIGGSKPLCVMCFTQWERDQADEHVADEYRKVAAFSPLITHEPVPELPRVIVIKPRKKK